MFYGLDFGFSNDPTVLTRNLIQGTFKDGGYLDGARLYSQELIYETGMTNNQIAARMEELGVRKHYDEIFADSAEPKSIQEVYDFGFNIKPCPKGADSVEFGHQRVRQLKQHWTKDSLRCIKEQRNFRYIADKNGKLTQKTTHNWSHGMDSRRYGVVGALSSIPGHIDPQPADKSEIAFRGVRKKEF
jgi:phage terminase large subunit